MALDLWGNPQGEPAEETDVAVAPPEQQELSSISVGPSGALTSAHDVLESAGAKDVKAQTTLSELHGISSDEYDQRRAAAIAKVKALMTNGSQIDDETLAAIVEPQLLDDMKAYVANQGDKNDKEVEAQQKKEAEDKIIEAKEKEEKEEQKRNDKAVRDRIHAEMTGQSVPQPTENEVAAALARLKADAAPVVEDYLPPEQISTVSRLMGPVAAMTMGAGFGGSATVDNIVLAATIVSPDLVKAAVKGAGARTN